MLAAALWGACATSTSARPATYAGDARLLVDGDAVVEAMREAIAGARHSVVIDYYIFGGPQAMELVDLLAKRQREGVAVRIVLDHRLGALPILRNLTQPVLARMQAAGLPVRFYAREAWRAKIGNRGVEDHNKVLVVDQDRAVVSSMNLGAPVLINHEIGLAFNGNAARALARDVLTNYAMASPAGLGDWPEHPLPRARGNAQIAYVPTGFGGMAGRETVLARINGAKRSVEVLMFQFNDDAVICALLAARQRGVEVRVLMDFGQLDHLSPLGWAPSGIFNLATARQLYEGGIEVRAYAHAGHFAMHGKSALVDGQHLLVGTTNWNRTGFDVNLESMFVVTGGTAPGQFTARFNEDWQTRSRAFDFLPGPLLATQLWLYQGLAEIIEPTIQPGYGTAFQSR